jgi:hypothetical protein
MFGLNFFSFFAGAFLGAGITVLEKTHPRISLNTFPSLPWKFRIADSILEFLAMRFLDVFSHHWHWQNVAYSNNFDNLGIRLKGAPYGNPQNNPLFGAIAHLGGRPWGHIVEAVRENPEEPYFIAFHHPGSNEMRRCNIELKSPVMLLSGPDNGCEVFAMDKNNTPLTLISLTNLIHRQDKPAYVRIL